MCCKHGEWNEWNFDKKLRSKRYGYQTPLNENGRVMFPTIRLVGVSKTKPITVDEAETWSFGRFLRNLSVGLYDPKNNTLFPPPIKRGNWKSPNWMEDIALNIIYKACISTGFPMTIPWFPMISHDFLWFPMIFPIFSSRWPFVSIGTAMCQVVEDLEDFLEHSRLSEP